MSLFHNMFKNQCGHTSDENSLDLAENMNCYPVNALYEV